MSDETPKEKPFDFNFSRLWDEKTTAAYLGLSVEFLQQDRVKKRRIAAIKLGRAVRYDPADVRAYAMQCKVGGPKRDELQSSAESQ